MPGGALPLVTGIVTIASHGASGGVAFLIDTGARSTLLAPRDVRRLGIDARSLSSELELVGVGGSMAAGFLESTLTLGDYSLELSLRVLIPDDRVPNDMFDLMPSILGRDVLAHFALILEQRTSRVLLLEPEEANRLHFPS